MRLFFLLCFLGISSSFAQKKDSIQAEINFYKGSFEVTDSMFQKQDLIDLLNWFKGSKDDQSITIDAISISSFESPDGENTKGSNLSIDRSTAVQNALTKRLEEIGLSKIPDFILKSNGEDWLGFKKAIQESDIADKEIIIRILTMYANPEQRRAEIMKMAKTYAKIETEIFPKLRRSEIVVHYHQ